MLEEYPEDQIIGVDSLTNNLEMVQTIIREPGKSEELITFVTDRKVHDMRYAIDPAQIHGELGWLPTTGFDEGIKETVKWYLDNRDWWEEIISGEYKNYYKKMYENQG